MLWHDNDQWIPWHLSGHHINETIKRSRVKWNPWHSILSLYREEYNTKRRTLFYEIVHLLGKLVRTQTNKNSLDKHSMATRPQHKNGYKRSNNSSMSRLPPPIKSTGNATNISRTNQSSLSSVSFPRTGKRGVPQQVSLLLRDIFLVLLFLLYAWIRTCSNNTSFASSLSLI